MKTTVRIGSAVLAAGFIASGLAFAAPATAAATISIDCTTSAKMVQVPAGDTVEITGCAAVAWTKSPSSATISVAAGNQTISSGALAATYSGTLTVSGIDAMESASMELYTSYPGGTRYQISFTGVSGGNSNSSSSPAVSPPVEVSLSLDLAASGASCREGSAAAGVMGAWLSLPAADDCSSTTDPDAKLLGWSTSANFPVQRAQSQVDNRWGAIDEVIDGVRMIFIPAGQATFVSGPNSLHPIWAN